MKYAIDLEVCEGYLMVIDMRCFPISFTKFQVENIERNKENYQVMVYTNF